MGACFGQQRSLKRCEIAQAHKVHPFLDGFRDFFVINARQNSGQTIAATADQNGDTGSTAGGTVDGG
jgi:hypothetical protein